eukprot:TRINITY_DN13589_c0_g1_i1.p1 TRINITY_DN13589_c0_g1~~TRINITY_DN13589_c0_g1_i1.p1  ORF type:complete len:484 (+),score=82.05 TRINITY_DN13589_c0_g1_i1:40-1452(+)
MATDVMEQPIALVRTQSMWSAEVPVLNVVLEADDYDLNQYFETKTFADVFLVVAGQRYHAHKLVLGARCNYFKPLIADGWTAPEVELPFPDPLHVFPAVLQFLYTNRIDITPDVVAATVAWSCQLEIDSLKKAIGEKLSLMVGADNALDTLRQALRYPDAQHIATACSHILAKHLPLLEDQLLDMDYNVFLALVSSDKIMVRSEQQFMEFVFKYIEKNSSSLTADKIVALMSQVAYCDLHVDVLRALLEHPLVVTYSPQLVISGLAQRISAFSEHSHRMKARHELFYDDEFRWHPKKHGKQIKVCKNSSVCKKSGDTAATIRTLTALGSTGQFYWEVMFTRAGATAHGSMGNCYYAGVVQDKDDCIKYEDSMCESSANWNNAWGMHDASAQAGSDKRHGGSTITYGTGYGFKDRVGVLVDMDAHTLSFYVNDVAQGVAFQNIPTDCIYPAITIYNDKVKCKLIAATKPAI